MDRLISSTVYYRGLQLKLEKLRMNRHNIRIVFGCEHLGFLAKHLCSSIYSCSLTLNVLYPFVAQDSTRAGVKGKGRKNFLEASFVVR